MSLLASFRQFTDEFFNQLQCLRRGFPLRKVLAVIQQYTSTARAHKSVDHLQLLQRSVLVIAPLYDEQRGCDRRQLSSEASKAEVCAQPTVAPAVECAEYVRAVMVREPLSQMTLIPLRRGKTNFSDCQRFNDYMGGESNSALYPTIVYRGVRKSYGGPVAVAHQDDAFQAERRNNLAQLFGAFITQVVEGARERNRAGVSIAFPAVSHDRTSGHLLQLHRKVAPLSDASQAFMEQDQGRERVINSGEMAVFDLYIAKPQPLSPRASISNNGRAVKGWPPRLAQPLRYGQSETPCFDIPHQSWR